MLLNRPPAREQKNEKKNPEAIYRSCVIHKSADTKKNSSYFSCSLTKQAEKRMKMGGTATEITYEREGTFLISCK